MITVTAPEHPWLRITERAWENPVDPTFAQRHGGRWNPPNSWPTVYLNADVATARANVHRFAARWPYEVEDLRPDAGPDLVEALLPTRQRVLDVDSVEGVASVGLPRSYPVDSGGEVVAHEPCRRIGRRARNAGLMGVYCRSAAIADGTGRELAWFPNGQHAVVRTRTPFAEWFHAQAPPA